MENMLVFWCPVRVDVRLLHVNSGRVHLHGRSYEGCATIVLKNTAVFFKVIKILDVQPIFTLRITAIRHGELKTRSPV